MGAGPGTERVARGAAGEGHSPADRGALAGSDVRGPAPYGSEPGFEAEIHAVIKEIGTVRDGAAAANGREVEIVGCQSDMVEPHHLIAQPDQHGTREVIRAVELEILDERRVVVVDVNVADGVN